MSKEVDMFEFFIVIACGILICGILATR